MKRLQHSLLPVLLACAAAAAAGVDGVAEERVSVSEAAQGALPGKSKKYRLRLDAQSEAQRCLVT